MKTKANVVKTVETAKPEGDSIPAFLQRTKVADREAAIDAAARKGTPLPAGRVAKAGTNEIARPAPAIAPTSKAFNKKLNAAAKAGEKAAIKAEAKAHPLASEKPAHVADRLLALLNKATARNAPALAQSPALPVPAPIAALRGPKAGDTLSATQVKIGMKVRVFSLNGDDRVSSNVFTIQALDKDEKTPDGGPWFAIDERRVVHFEDLRVA